MSSPSPKSPEPSDHNKKYDRQIRLWGEHGQHLLERANICLVDANAVGCEIMKNLILPGIGSFTVIDGGVVTQEDLGANFFVEKEAIGSPKSECCMRLLQELNSDVNGDFIDETIDTVLATKFEIFQTFDVVIASNLNEQTLRDLSNLLWNYNVPLVYCRSVGFMGSIRLQFKEHCVIESHPDNKQYDLRLENPFPALKEFLDGTEITAKTPWVNIIYKHLQKWKSDHDGTPPSNYKDKCEFRGIIQGCVTKDEENYEEAIKAVNTVFECKGTVPAKLSAIFDDELCQKPQVVKSKNSQFWIIVKALKDFIKNENDGLLPLPGILPDMAADTESYVKLQNIYRQKASQDADNVYRKCLNSLLYIGLQNEIISEKTVKLYCKEAAGLTFMRGSKISDEYSEWSKAQFLAESLECEQPLLEIYVVLRAYEQFLTENGYIPGDMVVEADNPRLKSIATRILQDLNIRHQISEDLVYEICHYGGAEIHSISAFVGAAAAQEVIKLLTQQYIPLNNTFLYSGITTETATYQF